MTLPIFSQTPSSNCTVPCVTLRNAIKVKYELDFVNNKISILRDSLNLKDSIIYRKDTLILNQNTIIENLNNTIIQEKKIIEESDKRVEFYKSETKTQKTYKWMVIVVGSLTTLASLIFF
jgi:hypothetical protein